VQLVHGLEGSPTGAKAQYLASFFDLLTPAMDTGDFPGCVEVQAEALARFRPQVLVGSSFGGAVAVELIRRGDWNGPTLLLAPALRFVGGHQALPPGVPVVVVHGTRDDVVPIEDSRALSQTGSQPLVELVEVDDEHRLASLLQGERLAELVHRVARSGLGG